MSQYIFDLFLHIGYQFMGFSSCSMHENKTQAHTYFILKKGV